MPSCQVYYIISVIAGYWIFVFICLCQQLNDKLLGTVHVAQPLKA